MKKNRSTSGVARLLKWCAAVMMSIFCVVGVGIHLTLSHQNSTRALAQNASRQVSELERLLMGLNEVAINESASASQELAK